MDTEREYQISFITILVICSYIACQMISNIASVKIANVLSLAVDGGTFLYPLAFINSLLAFNISSLEVTVLFIILFQQKLYVIAILE